MNVLKFWSTCCEQWHHFLFTQAAWHAEARLVFSARVIHTVARWNAVSKQVFLSFSAQQTTVCSPGDVFSRVPKEVR